MFCFLQAFYVDIGQKCIPGELDKKNMQGHESFILFTYDTLRRLIFNKFLESHNGIGEESVDQESSDSKEMF